MVLCFCATSIVHIQSMSHSNITEASSIITKHIFYKTSCIVWLNYCYALYGLLFYSITALLSKVLPVAAVDWHTLSSPQLSDLTGQVPADSQSAAAAKTQPLCHPRRLSQVLHLNHIL